MFVFHQTKLFFSIYRWILIICVSYTICTGNALIMLKTMKSLTPFGDFHLSSAFSAGAKCGNYVKPRILFIPEVIWFAMTAGRQNDAGPLTTGASVQINAPGHLDAISLLQCIYADWSGLSTIKISKIPGPRDFCPIPPLDATAPMESWSLSYPSEPSGIKVSHSEKLKQILFRS